MERIRAISIGCLLVCAAAARAQSPEVGGLAPAASNWIDSAARAGAAQKPEWSRSRAIWMASVGALVLANVADARTSWKKAESNRILAGPEGRFGARGLLIKGGINGLWVASQVFEA